MNAFHWFDLVKPIIIVAVVLNFIPLLIWFERKGAAYIQDRRGPNRASILGIRLGGMLHNIADVIKLINKEDIIPTQVNRFFYHLAPLIAIFVASVTVGVIPFAEPIQLGDYTLRFQIADLNIGILYILAVGSLGVYAVMLAGWSSHNSYALLGGMRSSAQMISYELAMGIALVSVLLTVGSARLPEIVASQAGGLQHWLIVRQPLAFFLFLTALFAETNRNPFDLPEGESEIVAGFHTEYSSMKFALFFMAEYAHIAVGSALLAVLFCGGWNLPFVDWEVVRAQPAAVVHWLLLPFALTSLIGGFLLAKRFRRGRYGDARDFEVLVFGIPGILTGIFALAGFLIFPSDMMWSATAGSALAALLQIVVMITKMVAFCWLFIQVRWTLPRFRYDQLMTLGWRVMLPLALANLTITAVVVALM